MDTKTSIPGEPSWTHETGVDAAAEGMRRILHRAARIGGQLSDRLSEAPLFKYGEAAPSRLMRYIEQWSKRLTIRSIMQLVVHRKHVRRTLQAIPIRMQLVTNQVRLVLELIDEFSAGTYRDIPWHSIAVAAGAILYSVSPSDIVPDFLPILGSVDDLLVLGLALKFIEKDLRAYARARGLEAHDYFSDPNSPVRPDSAEDVEAVES